LTTTEAVAAAKPSPVASQRSTSAKADEEDQELQRRQHALHDRPRGGVAPPALFLGVQRPRNGCGRTCSPVLGGWIHAVSLDGQHQSVDSDGHQYILTPTRFRVECRV
jgi:hypothetical protein